MQSIDKRKSEISLDKFLFFFILINGPIDLTVSFWRRFIDYSISPATLFRGATFLLSFIFIFVKVIKIGINNKTNKDKLNLAIICTTIITNLIFILTRSNDYTIANYFTEINELVRFLYFPYLFLLFLNMDIKNLNYFEEVTIRAMKILLSFYSLCIVIPFITNTGFDSYSLEFLEGNVGWLYGANEIGMIIGLLLHIFIIDIKNCTLSRTDYFIIFCAIISIGLLGTKGAFILALSFLLQVLFLLSRRITIKVIFKKYWMFILFFIIFTIYMLTQIPAVRNSISILSGHQPKDYLRILLSGRITFLEITWNEFLKAPLLNKIFGIGVLSRSSTGIYIHSKLIEMDVIEVFLRYGIFNLIIVFMPYIYLMTDIKKNLKSYTNDIVSKLLSITILMSLVLSFFIGHVVSTPSVSLVVILFILIVLTRNNSDYIESIRNEDVKYTKIFNPLEKIVSEEERVFISRINNYMSKKEKKVIITANPEILMTSISNTEIYENLLNETSVITADGIGTKVAVSLINNKKVNKITGVSIVEQLVNDLEINDKLFVYGSKQVVLDAFKSKLDDNTKKNSLFYNGYEHNEEFVKSEILRYKPDLVLICLGVPRQEKFIFDIIDEADSGIFIGCGGSLDVLSGLKQRAPKFIQDIHLEWLYRNIKEPKRFKRFYKSNVKFIFMILKVKISILTHDSNDN